GRLVLANEVPRSNAKSGHAARFRDRPAIRRLHDTSKARVIGFDPPANLLPRNPRGTHGHPRKDGRRFDTILAALGHAAVPSPSARTAGPSPGRRDADSEETAVRSRQRSGRDGLIRNLVAVGLVAGGVAAGAGPEDPAPGGDCPTYRHDAALSAVSPLKGGLAHPPRVAWPVDLGGPRAPSETVLVRDVTGDGRDEILLL